MALVEDFESKSLLARGDLRLHVCASAFRVVRELLVLQIARAGTRCSAPQEHLGERGAVRQSTRCDALCCKLGLRLPVCVRLAEHRWCQCSAACANCTCRASCISPQSPKCGLAPRSDACHAHIHASPTSRTATTTRSRTEHSQIRTQTPKRTHEHTCPHCLQSGSNHENNSCGKRRSGQVIYDAKILHWRVHGHIQENHRRGFPRKGEIY